MKLYVTTVNNSFQPLHIFCHKELHFRCSIGVELNIIKWYREVLEGFEGLPPWLSATLGKYEKLTLLDALKTHMSNVKYPLVNSLIFVLSSQEKAHDSKEFSRENWKPWCESQIMTLWVEPCYSHCFFHLSSVFFFRIVLFIYLPCLWKNYFLISFWFQFLLRESQYNFFTYLYHYFIQ